MSKRMRKPSATGGNYKKRIKDYFGFHLKGLDINENGGELQVQLVYLDFKHIDTVRRELAQMMPEVEFTKIKREFTMSAAIWALTQMLYDDDNHPEPTIYVKRNNGDLTSSSLWDIACSELRQLELDDDEDNIPYSERDREMTSDDRLRDNAND